MIKKSYDSGPFFYGISRHSPPFFSLFIHQHVHPFAPGYHLGEPVQFINIINDFGMAERNMDGIFCIPPCNKTFARVVHLYVTMVRTPLCASNAS